MDYLINVRLDNERWQDIFQLGEFTVFKSVFPELTVTWLELLEAVICQLYIYINISTTYVYKVCFIIYKIYLLY